MSDAYATVRACFRALVVACLSLAGCPYSSVANAHSGGLDAQGCHTNRKTGDYHCHRASGNRSTTVPDRSKPTGGTYYRNCSEVRAASKAPLRRGEPGYAPHLDRDGDGIACE